MPFHPRMDDPSNPRPSLNVSSSQISIGKEQCCHDPSMSTNFRSTISASCFLARVKKSAGFIRVLPKSHSFGPDVPRAVKAVITVLGCALAPMSGPSRVYCTGESGQNSRNLRHLRRADEGQISNLNR